ncbi:hypothetical protein B4U37_07505 [Sutcliffiella horikoshii]|uniref:Putative Flp pilus-assembly TadG-like N-terminal domain-containing protein n=1 Tax=Sutcliffiella horikoshii TaxID=79883 RepID=A0ABM6KHG4_9BACI|nr:TadE/TadG family type IV pilus assembly protein [Sutcliffiella horikoshii]ART75883.1 hypothetical protein B4U37_07505 [Sutcliffiella horikoshii]
MLRSDKGNAMVMMAFILSLLVALSGFVVDGGRLYLQKGELQKAIDAAALAGVQQVKNSQINAVNAAIELASLNGISINSSNIIVGSDSVEIHNTVPVETTFAKVLGFNSIDVAATSKAVLDTSRGIKKHSNVIPVGIPKDKLVKGQSHTLHFTPAGGNNGPQQGNFGFLAIGGRGAANLEDNIVNGIEVEITPGSYVLTEPGLKWGKVRSGFQERISMDATKPLCNQLNTSKSGCARVAILPIVNDLGSVNGRGKVEIIGFAAFWIEKVEQIGGNKSVTGYFIDIVTSGEFSEEVENFGISTIKLVN